jgi:phosphodiesterase/alkaline phosphatase D-like protein
MMKKSKLKYIMVPFLSVVLSVLALLPLSITPAVAAVTPPTVSTIDASSITINSAILNGNLSSLGTAISVTVFFEYGTTTSYGNSTSAIVMTTTGLFSANLNGISSGITYHFRAKADGGVNGVTTGDDKTFTTSTTPPVARTSMASNVIANGAVLNGYLDSLGTATSVSVHFEYGTTSSYGKTTPIQTKTSTGTITANLTGLTPNTTYHFRVKADSGIHGTSNGLDMTFTTPLAIIPQVSTNPAIFVTENSAKLVGNVASLGSTTSVTVSFEYGTTTNYGTTSSTTTMSGAGYYGGFSIDITGLTSGTTYHFRAKADGGANGIDYGNDTTFTTPGIAPPTAPTVNTSDATDITTGSAKFNGNLLLMGTASSVNVFFEYGKTASYGNSTIAQTVTATGNFSIDITGLTPGTTYHFRAKADSGVNGVANGSDMTFTTATVSPTVDTSAATGITNNAVTLNGNLISTGTAASITVSFEYGITDKYGITTSTQTLTGKGIYSINLTGLKPNTVYHFRAKADGGVNGNAAGNDMTFTTLGPSAITLAPNSSLKINPSEATSGENVSISVTVLNSGGASGTYELVLRINGLIEKTREATVPAGASQEVIFNVTKEVAGTYQVDINGLTGSFVVTKNPVSTVTTTTLTTTTTGTVKTANSMQILAIGLGAAVVVGLLIYLLTRRRA